MKKLFAVAAVSLCFASACASGAGSAASAPGIYELDKAAMKKTILDAAQRPSADDKAKLDKMVDELVEARLELNADGTFTTYAKMMNEVKSVTGTWRVEGDKLLMTAKNRAGEDMPTGAADFADGVITIEMGEGRQKVPMVLRKK